MLSFIPTYNPIANGVRSMYMPQQERLHKLNQIAIQQMTVLENAGQRNVLKA